MNPLEFTGERYIPGQGGAQIAYEHLHRYLFAMRWAKGKQVLDVATGSGFGAALLASVARRVCAVELDWSAVTHARGTTSSSANLVFVQGDATRIPVLTGSADLVVAMEILEHVAEPETLVCELARVVRPDGAVLISTPNKASYSDARKYRNPFHVHEFYRDEFMGILERHFSHVRLMHQQVRAGSLVSCAAGCQGEEIITEPLEGRNPTEASYFLALCSHRDQLDDWAPALSAYLDISDALQQEWQQELVKLNGEIEALGRWGHGLDEQIKQTNEILRGVLNEVQERDQTIRGLQHEKETEIAQRDEIIRGLQHENETEVARRDEALKHLQEEFEGRTRWAMDLLQDVKEPRGQRPA